MCSFPAPSYARPMQDGSRATRWVLGIAIAAVAISSCGADITDGATTAPTRAAIAPSSTTTMPATTTSVPATTSTVTSTTLVEAPATTAAAAPVVAPPTTPPAPPTTEAPAPEPAPQPTPSEPPAEEPLTLALDGTWSARITAVSLVHATGCLADKSLEFTAGYWTVGQMTAGACATINRHVTRQIGCMGASCYFGVLRITRTSPTSVSVAYGAGACPGLDLGVPSVDLSADLTRLTLHHAECESYNDAVAVVMVDEVLTKQ